MNWWKHELLCMSCLVYLCILRRWKLASFPSKMEKQGHSHCNFLPLTHSSRHLKIYIYTHKQYVKCIMFTNQSKTTTTTDTSFISFNKHFANGISWSWVRVKDCKMIIWYAVYSIFMWKSCCAQKGKCYVWKEYKRHMTTAAVHNQYCFVDVIGNSTTTFFLMKSRKKKSKTKWWFYL